MVGENFAEKCKGRQLVSISGLFNLTICLCWEKLGRRNDGMFFFLELPKWEWIFGWNEVILCDAMNNTNVQLHPSILFLTFPPLRCEVLLQNINFLNYLTQVQYNPISQNVQFGFFLCVVLFVIFDKNFSRGHVFLEHLCILKFALYIRYFLCNFEKGYLHLLILEFLN